MMSDATVPPRIAASIDALRADARVFRPSLETKVEEVRSHLRAGSALGATRAEDVGAELRVAAHLLRAVPDIDSLVFPTDDPPDISLRLGGEEVTVEVTRLAARVDGPTSDTAVIEAEAFSPRLLANCSEGRADWHVWNQVRGKLRKTARRGRTANILVAVSDSPTIKWTLPAATGAWRAVAGATIDDEPVPFGDVVIWYGGPILNEVPRKVGANRAHQTSTSRSLIEKAFPGIGPYLLGGPGDHDWDRAKARRELHYMWEFDDRGRSRLPDAVE